MNPNDCKVLFYSEDGLRFKLFIEGREVVGRQSIQINAGNDEIVTVTPTLVFAEGFESIRDKKVE